MKIRTMMKIMKMMLQFYIPDIFRAEIGINKKNLRINY